MDALMFTLLVPFLFNSFATSTLISTTLTGVTRQECIQKDFGYTSFVCVCNSTYCDTIEENTPIPKGQYTVYLSTKLEKRLAKSLGKFQDETHYHSTKLNETTLEIQHDVVYQEILGFGGAFTDAATLNIASLTGKTQENLLNSYFGPGGLEYTLGRVNMASCDFSTHEYSYDDHSGDFNLSKFSLAVEDIKYKISTIQEAQRRSRRPIRMFASPWSAPAWMKTNKEMTGKGTLIGQPGGPYYQTWANYFVRFLQEYEKRNVTFWGLTAQNEPTNGLISNFSFQATGFTAELQRDFILKDLGPALHKNGYEHVKLMILDDQRLFLPRWAKEVASTPEVAQYISGIAVHWYLDLFVPPVELDLTHNAMPDKFILATEACEGSQPWQKYDHVVLGAWERFDSYAHSIIQDLQHWVVGWTDWNIALNMEGGPNWVNNYVDSPIIVNKEKDEFYKQPMFYALGHFSKFVLPGAKRLGMKASKHADQLNFVAFSNPDKSTVLIIHNRGDQAEALAIKDPTRGIITTSSPPNSMQTFIWW